MSTNNEEEDVLAPGHKYLKRLGSGIKWSKDKVLMYLNNEIIGEANHTTSSEWDYFYNLVFRESFPDVTHWWFHSAWTQRVRCTQGIAKSDGTTLVGHMQFINNTETPMTWSLWTEGDKTVVNTPYPPKEAKPINIPLRMALARLVLKAINYELPIFEDGYVPWQYVTSLCETDLLDRMYPTDIDTYGYVLHQSNGVSHREYLCRLQNMDGCPSC